MKVGDYVRTDEGEICKVTSVAKDNLGFGNMEFCNTEPFVYGNIVKSRPKEKIIELIEVGDYVNGCKIIELSTNIDGKVLYLETDITEFDNVYACGHINIYENDIKSIVTKEQFKNIEYEVK